MKHTYPFLLLLTLCLCCRCTPHTAEPEIRNIIFLIGDGMGLAQTTALATAGGYAPTQFDRVRCIGIQKTYSANNRVTDSAAAGTALATGTKTDNGTIGLSPDGTPLESALQAARRAEQRAAELALIDGYRHAQRQDEQRPRPGNGKESRYRLQHRRQKHQQAVAQPLARQQHIFFAPCFHAFSLTNGNGRRIIRSHR